MKTYDELPNHMKRVHEEHRVLTAKIELLYKFIHGAIFQDLSREEQMLLDMQLTAMQTYEKILYARLELA